MKNLSNIDLSSFIDLALQEDVGSGDHTSLSTIPAGTNSRAQLLVKEDGILAGVRVAEAIFQKIDPTLNLQILLQDQQMIQSGDIVLKVEGSVHSILKAERLVLNLMQRMSGIASTTHRVVQMVKHTNCKILDTRKTTPLLRFLEKEAVAIGGGHNHRFCLFDMILIKDNHVDYAGGIRKALQGAKNYLSAHSLNIPIEIETRSLKEVEEALAEGGFLRIMFDNFSYDEIRTAIEMVNHQCQTEASGGITLENVVNYAETGVDCISMGALTHSVKSLDLSLKAY